MKKTFHQSQRGQFSQQAEEEVLQDFLGVQEVRERQIASGPKKSIDAG